MKLHVLITLPLAGAAAALLLGHWRRLTAALSLAALTACAWVALQLPAEVPVTFLGQVWMLDQTVRTLLVYAYGATALLLVAAAITDGAVSVFSSLLAGAGLFSAIVLLQSPSLSLFLLPVAMVLPVLATLPSALAAVRGASNYLTWLSLPIPFLLAAFWLLQRFALFPDETALPNWSAWLTVPPIVLWLTLFPFDGASHTWAEGSPPLAPAFVWAVKDPVLIYLWLRLWQQTPYLHTSNTAAAIGALGLATVVTSGLSAVLYSNPSAVLACASMSTLGIAVQGLTIASERGLEAMLVVLFSRSAAVLLGTTALAVAQRQRLVEDDAKRKLIRWQDIVPFAVVVTSIVAMMGMPYWRGLLGPSYVHSMLQARMPGLLEKSWRIAALGIAIGLVRATWALRRRK